MRRVLDPSTMVFRALGGNIELIVETPADQIARLEQAAEFNLEVYQSLSFNAFGYNNAHPILQEKQVRRALTHAVDRDEMLRNWYEDKGTVIGGPFVPGHPFYNPSVEPLAYDPAQARQLLSQAGYVDRDGDGIRETSAGEDVSFRLVTLIEEAATATVKQNVAESYVDYLREVGVRVEVVNQVKDKYLESVFRKKDFDIAWVKWEFDPSYDIASLFRTESNNPGGDNIVNYSNPKVDELLQEYVEADDPERRRQIMYNTQQIIAEDSPYTFLYTVDNYATMHFSIVSTRVDPYYFFSYYDSWYIAPDFR
jgi:peptide/nickel transport system substrate-binding protein